MIFEEFEEKKTGADLINIIQSNTYLQYAPIKYTIAYLLKKRLIKILINFIPNRELRRKARKKYHI